MHEPNPPSSPLPFDAYIDIHYSSAPNTMHNISFKNFQLSEIREHVRVKIRQWEGLHQRRPLHPLFEVHIDDVDSPGPGGDKGF